MNYKNMTTMDLEFILETLDSEKDHEKISHIELELLKRRNEAMQQQLLEAKKNESVISKVFKALGIIILVVITLMVVTCEVKVKDSDSSLQLTQSAPKALDFADSYFQDAGTMNREKILSKSFAYKNGKLSSAQEANYVEMIERWGKMGLKVNDSNIASARTVDLGKYGVVDIYAINIDVDLKGEKHLIKTEIVKYNEVFYVYSILLVTR